MFSAMITAPSTMIPKSMAPSDSRLAEDAAEIHENECEQERERDGDGDDERRAEVVEQEREQHGHEGGALDEVSQHRVHGGLDEPVPAVVRPELDIRRQDPRL